MHPWRTEIQTRESNGPKAVSFITTVSPHSTCLYCFFEEIVSPVSSVSLPAKPYIDVPKTSSIPWKPQDPQLVDLSLSGICQWSLHNTIESPTQLFHNSQLLTSHYPSEYFDRVHLTSVHWTPDHWIPPNIHGSKMKILQSMMKDLEDNKLFQLSLVH